MITVAIDPGLRDQGVAVFRDQTLIAATLIRVPGKERGPAQWCEVAYRTHEWVSTQVSMLGQHKGQVVSEHPQSYIASQQKGDQNDLCELAGVVGATCLALSRGTSWSVTGYLPQEWKGQVPKDVHNARVLKRLSPEEFKIVETCGVPESLLHNVIDSVGIALFHLGRLERRRVV